MNESRWCGDIGMLAIDRPIPLTCVHATDFCRATCYNEKLYKVYPRMRDKDIRNEEFWQQLDGAQVSKILQRSILTKRSPKKRLRLMTRGEAVKDFTDIPRIKEIALANPDTEIWMPTRSWRDPILRAMVETELFPIANLSILASTDPTTSVDEWSSLRMDGWNTMFYGDDDMTVTPNGDRVFECPKTHKGMKGHCGICRGGCFRKDKRVDVHLTQH